MVRLFIPGKRDVGRRHCANSGTAVYETAVLFCLEVKMLGLIHIYCGKGKGKTTASVGLSVRAAGAGKRVLFVQFFKNGVSSEVKSLRLLPGVETLICEKPVNFFMHMDDEQKNEAREIYSQLLEKAIEQSENADLLVLDEIISTCNYGIADESRLIDFLKTKREDLEVVLTGREPSENLMACADYITEMTKIKHPYDEGINARQGIEF